ncbi:MAG: hypothetical protein DRQ24_08660, partial [Candidatus Latescibacterota bacterium]
KRHVYETDGGAGDGWVRKPAGKGGHWLDPYVAAGFLRVFSVLYKLGGDLKDREFARACLEHLKRSAVCVHGTYIWNLPTPSTCDHGRYWTNILFAAECLEDEDTLRWLEGAIEAWPYFEDRGLFYVHFSPVTLKEHAHNHPYNMELEAAVPAWIVGRKLRNKVLMERGRRVVEDFFLANQRPDGFWDYDYEGVYGTERLEYLYSAYSVFLASRLLAYPEWREVLFEPLRRSLDATLRDCLRRDGSVYTPTHWGWGHIWESTALVCAAAWHFQRYCWADYGEVVARGVDWVLRCRLREWGLDPPPHECGLVTQHMAELAYRGVEVEGERAETAQVLRTLRRVRRDLFKRSRPQLYLRAKPALSHLIARFEGESS